MTGLFDLWRYNAFAAPLQVAGAERNADECIRLLQKMLSAILSEMEQDSAYDFLREHKDFHPLITKYKMLAAESNPPRE